MRIEDARADEFPAIAHFYARQGYTRGVQPGDRVIVAREDGACLGAVRLCAEHGVLVLRGMYVEAGRRGEGVGTALLRAAETAIAGRECWCIPYASLVRFYGRAGFREVAGGAMPAHLRTRLGSYAAEGYDVTVLVRAAINVR